TPIFRSPPFPRASTWSIVISWPMSAAICSTLILSPEATRYCLPPVFMTAYMVDLTWNAGPRGPLHLSQTDFWKACDYNIVCDHSQGRARPPRRQAGPFL